MEIGNLSVAIGGGSAGGYDWGWIQSKSRDIARSSDPHSLRSQIGELLFGVQMSQLQMMEYRLKLAKVLELIDEFEGPSPALSERLLIPAERRIFAVGAVKFQPSSVERGELFTATPAQVFHKRKLLKLNEFLAREEETTFASSNFKVAVGLKLQRGGADKILLTPAGVQEILQPTCEPVISLRLPPRCYKQVEIVRAAKLGTQRGRL